MERKDQPKEKVSFEFHKDEPLNDYQMLFLKLKKIKENISLLEKNFLAKNK